MNRISKMNLIVLFMSLFVLGFASQVDAQRYQPFQGQPIPTVRPQIRQLQATTQTTVLEAENQRGKVSIGRIIKQDMRQFGTWSGNQQLLWVDNRPGHRMELPFTSPRAGKFPVTVNLTKAADFADLAIGFNGRQLATFSGYSASVARAPVSLGHLDLRAGVNTLIFNVTGKDRRSTNYRVGVDSVDIRITIAAAPPRDPGTNRLPVNPGQLDGQTWRPQTIPEISPEAKYPDRFTELEVKMPGGADIFVPSGEFVSRDPQEIYRGNYELSLGFDVNKVPGAGAAIFQITENSFSVAVEGEGLPQTKPHSLKQSGVLSGKSGFFRIDVRQFVHGSRLANPAEFYIRVIPIVSATDQRFVGKASNIIDIYYNKKAPTTEIKLAKYLQVQAFADMVESRLSGRTSGYALAIIPKGKPPVYRAGGVARTSVDGDQRAMTVHDRVNLASVTKLVTAIMVIKAFDANPTLSLESKISPFLPVDWTKGPNVETVTFRQALIHMSGLRTDDPNGMDDNGVRKVIEAGIPDLAAKTKPVYVNQNFALMRLLLPHIKTLQGAGGNGAKFVRDANLTVLQPAGIGWVSGTPDDKTALSYPFPTEKFKGTNFDAKTEEVGSSGLHMSAAEIATLMDRLVNSSDVLRPDLREELIGWNLGCVKLQDAGGRCFGKGGLLFEHFSDSKSTPANRAEINTVAYAFSDGTVVGLVVNSSYSPDLLEGSPYFSDLLRKCFNSCYREF